MGASGKMDAEIPPDAREQCLRFKLRPAVRVLAQYSIVGVTAVANSSFLCTGAITLVTRSLLTSCLGRYYQCPRRGVVHYIENLRIGQWICNEFGGKLLLVIALMGW